ncbi:hypothetical protein M422DRAFT_96086, partial [Sphaerobolus stellatus SS14]
HPEVKAKQPQRLNPKHAHAFNPATFKAHSELLAEIISKYEIPVENIYNTDEKESQLGGGQKASTREQIFGASDENMYILKGDSLLLITFIEMVCADDTVSLGVIMPPEATGDWHAAEGIGCFSQSVNRWTDNFICNQWFEKTFIPFVKGCNISGKPILLISEGHQSHETPEMHALAFNNCIILYYLPPKTTHKLQPLDVGVFGPLQLAW